MASNAAGNVKQSKMDEAEAQRIIEQFDDVQGQLDKLNEMASEEILKVEIKFNKQRIPHYKRRSELISKLPHFWATVFINHPQLSSILDTDDENVLQYLRTIEIEDSEDMRSGYVMKFYFNENPYFENDVLVKEFNISDNCDSESKYTPIKWKPNMNFTVIRPHVDDRLINSSHPPHQSSEVANNNSDVNSTVNQQQPAADGSTDAQLAPVAATSDQPPQEVITAPSDEEAAQSADAPGDDDEDDDQSQLPTLADELNSRKRSHQSYGFFSWYLDETDMGTDEIGEIIKDDIFINPLQYYLASCSDGNSIPGGSYDRLGGRIAAGQLTSDDNVAASAGEEYDDDDEEEEVEDEEEGEEEEDEDDDNDDDRDDDENENQRTRYMKFN